MAKTHWKKMVNMDYLGTYSLDDGKDITLTIDYVRQEVVTGNSGRKEQCMVAHFKENVKPMILNRTNAKTITKVVGSPYVEDWNGKRITLYADTTRFGGDIVECLRVRPYSPPETKRNEPKQAEVAKPDLICEKCGAVIGAAFGMTAEGVAEKTKATYGKRLCGKCAQEAKAGA
jgi:hypothetical protein